MKKVSVIMASYLGDYPNRATNPQYKFMRAVKSFMSQTYQNKELIIVADGCDITENWYNINYKNIPNIKFIKIEKQSIYSGECRNTGLNIADGDIISYLDNDDVLGKKHLEIIMNQFTEDVDMVYYDDYLVISQDFKKLYKRNVETRWGSIGTSAISHINFNNNDNFKHIKWTDGYGHDFVFLSTMIINGVKFKKLKDTPQYLVAHYGSGKDKGDF